MFPKIDSLEIHSDYLFDRKQAESGHLFTQASVQVESIEAKNEVTIGSMKLESSNKNDREIAVGEIIPSIEAVDWSNKNVDIRPRLVDSSSGEVRLLDSGAQISATKRKPEDKVDNSINLIAVNGSRIQTYGYRDLEFKINRKTYKIPAIVCDVAQDILGFDFIKKYKLNFEWEDEELFIVDKRAQIKVPVKILATPTLENCFPHLPLNNRQSKS